MALFCLLCWFSILNYYYALTRLKNFVIMSYYGRESHSKTPEERMKEMVRLWNYDVEWLRFIPKEETTPLSLEELKDMRDNLPENRQFGFAMMAGGAVSCENKHGGLLLMRHGYLPVFWSCRSVYTNSRQRYCKNFLQYLFLFDKKYYIFIIFF